MLIAADSLIRCHDGTNKPVTQLRQGEVVLCFYPQQNRIIDTKITKIEPLGVQSLNRIVAFGKECLIGTRLYNRVLVYNEIFLDNLFMQNITHVTLDAVHCEAVDLETEHKNCFVNDILFYNIGGQEEEKSPRKEFF